MRNKINKNIYRGILVLSFLILNGFIFYGASSVLAYLKTGADRSNMLHVSIKNEDVYLPKIEWTSLDNEGREISNQELKTIEDNYLKSWHIKNIAYATNNPYGIEDFYTDSARVHIYNTIELNKQKQLKIEATTINHNPKLEFYSEDGKLVVITDNNVVEHQKVYLKDQLVISETDTSAYRILLLLEDGFWRVRHKVKIQNEVKDETYINKKFATVKDNNILINGNPFIIKGINYYPQDMPWDMFGEKFDIETIKKDFDIIKNANLNSIRIFIQYEDFGKERVSKSKLEKLKRVLDEAEFTGLKVIVTLFDFYGNYAVNDWTFTHRHAEQIVSKFKNHKAILAWDVKNEPDLDFDSRDKEIVTSWLSEIIHQIKKFDPNHLITIGWSSTDAAINLVNEVDFVSYHYYKDIANFELDLSVLKNNSMNKPLVLQEFGLSSYSGIWNGFNGSEKKQASYYKKMQAILKKDSLAFMSWGLYDFKSIPKSVVGRLPWRKSKQKFFGFIDDKGRFKPSYLYITY